MVVLIIALAVGVVWAAAHFLQPAPPRRIVLASGPESGLYHRHAQRYIEILRRAGVTVEERMTHGAGQNLGLLLDANSGVDIALTQGGVARFPEADGLVMLASLYYEPLWIFYRGADALTQVNQLRGLRISIGIEGSGTRALALAVLAANGLTSDKVTLFAMDNDIALRALQSGEIDAAMFVAGTQSPAVWKALHDPNLKLMSLKRADAYPRRFTYLNKLTLPPGAIDLSLNIPVQEVALIGTKAMLAARDGLHPALINLLTDAAREIHGAPGYFEEAGEFPGIAHVDLRVSAEADRHRRFGPSFHYRYLPFWVATIVERMIIVLLPLAVVLVPLFNYLPQFLRWRVRSRVYRWYGELALLERDVATRTGALPIEKWLADLDRIEHAVAQIRTPVGFASEAYTLREHIGLVRRAVTGRTGSGTIEAST